MEAVQPRKMFLSPVAFTVEREAVSRTQGDNLLLCLLEHSLGIVTHTDILFHRVIFLCGNEHTAVLAVAKAPSNALGIYGIAFLGLVFWGGGHGGRCHNDTLHRKALPLVRIDFFIQRVPKTSGFVSAEESAVTALDLIQLCQILPLEQSSGNDPRNPKKP